MKVTILITSYQDLYNSKTKGQSHLVLVKGIKEKTKKKFISLTNFLNVCKDKKGGLSL